MAGNTIGTIFRLTSFGESHGKAIGGIVDGCPAGLEIDIDYIQQELNRRKPGQSSVTTTREEDDSIEFLSGIFEGETTGTPIAFIVKNNNQKSDDYNHLKDTYRPSHADYTYEKKYGLKDHRGGGRSSARETIARVVAGAIAKLYLMHHEISIQAYSSQIGDVKLEKNYTALDLSKIEDNIVRCPDEKVANKMIAEINKVKAEGDTIGGVISCVIKGSPLGLGEPVFDKLQADLAKAMLSINAAKGFEYGAGFGAAKMKGSEHNDQFSFDAKKNKVYTNTNFSGGIQGGISNGEDIYFNVAFKPVATIMKPQQTINKKNKELTLEAKGRHDACVLPRAVPIVEAMAAIVLTDHLLRNNCAVCKY